MSYEDRVKNELNCYNMPAVTRDFAWGLAKEADKELEAKDQKIKEISNALVKHLHEEDSYINEIEAKDKLIADTLEAVGHMQYKLKHQPDIASMDHGVNDRVLIDCKKVVNQLIKYLTKEDRE